jgi:hypothetical protein
VEYIIIVYKSLILQRKQALATIALLKSECAVIIFCFLQRGTQGGTNINNFCGKSPKWTFTGILLWAESTIRMPPHCRVLQEGFYDMQKKSRKMELLEM